MFVLVCGFGCPLCLWVLGSAPWWVMGSWMCPSCWARALSHRPGTRPRSAAGNITFLLCRVLNFQLHFLDLTWCCIPPIAGTLLTITSVNSNENLISCWVHLRTTRPIWTNKSDKAEFPLLIKASMVPLFMKQNKCHEVQTKRAKSITTFSSKWSKRTSSRQIIFTGEYYM